jgi:hypothetical protein
MNSSVPDVVPTQEPRVRTPRLSLVLTTIYVVLLISVGSMMWAKQSADWSLLVAFLPALIYAISTFVYGGALFGKAAPARRARAWSHVLWISAFLYTPVFVASVVIAIFTEPDLLVDFPYWKACPLAIVTVLLPLWARIGSTVFVRSRPSGADERSAVGAKLGLSLLVGGAMMLSSLVLDVGYSDTGWAVITWQGGWVTNAFIDNNVLWPWMNGLTLAGYAVGIVLALLSVIAGIMALAKKSLAPKAGEVGLNISLVIFWFTLTNYYSACFYLVFVGTFNIWTFPRMESAVITLAWLAMFALGTALWFKYRSRTDERGTTIRTALLLWALPLMPVTISTFWVAAAWGLYGLVLYVAGLQIVAACWWKMAGPLQRTSNASS